MAAIKEPRVYVPYLRARGDALYRMGQKNAEKWTGASAETWVGLYVVCHELVYKTEPAELKTAKEFRRVRGMAARFLVEPRFADEAAIAEYFQWAWERARAAWEKIPDCSRMRLEGLLSVRKHTDYLAALARDKDSRGGR